MTPSRLVLGSMALTIDELDRSLAVIDEFVLLGGNAIDTAHVYGPSRHKAVGEYLRLRGRDKLIVMDKGCHPYGRNRVTREDMAADIAENQERMGIGRTDYFVLHRDAPEVPVGDIVEWLNEHVQAGHIDHFGGSNWLHTRLEAANRYADEHGLQGFSMSSPNLALAVPNEPMWTGAYSVDREGRDWYERTGFPLFSWSSGAGGFFAGLDTADVHRVYDSEENFRRRTRADELAKKFTASPTQIAVAWTLNQPMNVHAIVGPATVEQVRDVMQAAEIKLTPEELRYLEWGE